MIVIEIKVVMVIVNLSHDNVISSINDTNASNGIAITIDIHFIVSYYRHYHPYYHESVGLCTYLSYIS